MPHNNNDFLRIVLEWISNNSTAVYTAILAIITSFFRLAYDKKKGRQRFVESVLCGLIALAVSESLEYFGFPANLSPFIGGMIGFFGIDKIREISSTILNRKLKSDESKKDED